MRIYIAGKDIKAGKKSDCGKCPIALAIKRRIPSFNVFVGFYTVEIFSDFENSKIYYLCQRGRKFISDFDKDVQVKPFHLYMKENV